MAKRSETAEEVAARLVQEAQADSVRGEPLRIRSRDDLMCGVERIEYDVSVRRGKLCLPHGYSANMEGIVRLFTDIDPQAVRIEVYSGDVPENVYKRESDGEWEVYDVRQA